MLRRLPEFRSRTPVVALVVVLAVATTVGAWHVHPASGHGHVASAPTGASLTTAHECPTCALGHAPSTPPASDGMLVPPVTAAVASLPDDTDLVRPAHATGVSPRGPPRSV